MDASELVARAGAAALATDPDNRVVAWNGAAEELFGHPAAAALGRGLADVLEARDVFGNRLCPRGCALHEMVQQGEPVQAFELEVTDAAGARARVGVSVIVVLGPAPGRWAVVYLFQRRRRRRRADEVIDRLLAAPAGLAAPLAAPAAAAVADAGLTARQREVLRHVAAGEESPDIAAALGISVNTVRSHTQAILRRLGVRRRSEAVSVALRRGLL